MENRFCAYCGKELVEGASFCASCGTKIEGGVTVADDHQPPEAKPVETNAAPQTGFFEKNKRRVLIASASALVLIIAIGIAVFVTGSPSNRLIGDWHHFYSENVERVITIQPGGKCHMRFFEDGKLNDDYFETLGDCTGDGTWEINGDKVTFKWDATEFEGLKAKSVTITETGTLIKFDGDCLSIGNSKFWQDQQHALDSYRISQIGKK